MARVVGCLQGDSSQPLHLLLVEVAGGERLGGALPADEVLQLGGLHIEVGQLPEPDRLVPKLLVPLMAPAGQSEQPGEGGGLPSQPCHLGAC